MVQAQQLEIGTRYGLEILHQCGGRVKTKTQKISEANFYVCRETTGRRGLPPILNRVKDAITDLFKIVIKICI